MSRVVLDASAALAAFAQEPGADIVAAVLEDSAISAVNVAEICSKLVSRGLLQKEAEEASLNSARYIFPFDTVQALLSGTLIQQTRRFGLSLADRACLALAITLKAPVYTTDKTWNKLNLDIEIRLIR